MSPMATISVNSGAQRDTPATSAVSWVWAMNHVSTMLYTSDTSMLMTTGSAILKYALGTGIRSNISCSTEIPPFDSFYQIFLQCDVTYVIM